MQNLQHYKVELLDGRYNLLDTAGDIVKNPPGKLYSQMKKKVVETGNCVVYTGSTYKQAPMSEYTKAKKAYDREKNAKSGIPKEQQVVMNMIHSSYDLKPTGLKMNELKWKYLIRSAVRGKNIMMTGPSGCGKTMAAKALVNGLERPDFYFNLGATQDPRSTLIGNVQFNKEDGTYFSESLFVKAIQTPNAVILMDELSRAHPDAWNILMTVLDQGQRYLRLDEASGQETINVANGVTFIATANIGNEYTSTRVMDKALMDRFTIIEMDLLSSTEESELLQYMYPRVSSDQLDNVAEICSSTRIEAQSETARVESGISTRTAVELAGLLYDGFSLAEASEITIYPQYSKDGGVDSERTFVKQLVQKYCDDGSEEDLFNTSEMEDSKEYATAQ
jgi:nitric oxide reductase NorQ protein